MEYSWGVLRDGVLAVMGVLAVLAGCAAAPSSEPPVSERPSSSALPPGAIPAGDDVYMVPVGRDADGCAQYRMHAPGRAVVQAIFYADGKGGFTMNRAEADCPPAKPPGVGR